MTKTNNFLPATLNTLSKLIKDKDVRVKRDEYKSKDRNKGQVYVRYTVSKAGKEVFSIANNYPNSDMVITVNKVDVIPNDAVLSDKEVNQVWDLFKSTKSLHEKQSQYTEEQNDVISFLGQFDHRK